MMKKKKSKGVLVFGFLLIWAGIYKIFGYSDYKYYKYMFQQLPSDMILIRYVFSIALRVLTISIGFGVLNLKEFFRKSVIALGIFTLCTLYWKHPYYVFRNVAVMHEQNMFGMPSVPVDVHDLAYPMFPWISLIFYYSVDIIFSLSIIYFFTRPKVKEQFK